jgi:hypothetical protein
MIPMSEDPQPGAAPDMPDMPGMPDVQATASQGKRLTDKVVSRLSDQARQTSQAARARRVSSTDGEPGVLDMTPLRDLLAELVEDMRKLRTRERIAHALRQAADAIDPPAF